MRPQPTSRRALHAEPVILFGVGAGTFAISAKDVDEIRDKAGLLPPGPEAPSPKVKSRLLRERKTYWVIDGSDHFRMAACGSSRLLVLRNANAAVLVDRIDRMAEIGAVLPLPRAFRGEERGWYRGLAVLDEGPNPRAIPVVNADSFAQAVMKAGATR